MIVTDVGMGCGGRGSVGRETESQGEFPVSDHRHADDGAESAFAKASADGYQIRRDLLRGWLRTAKPCGPGTRCWCQVGGGDVNPTGSGNTLIR
jgi:hypothetical protein